MNLKCTCGGNAMAKSKKMNLGIRIDDDTLYRFKKLSDFENRSLVREILHLINKEVLEHEQKYGEL